MAIKIVFDHDGNPLPPSFVLANRNGNKLGLLPAVSISTKGNMNSAASLQFKVYKENNGVACPLWDQIQDFKLVWCPEWDVWFETTVETVDGEGTYKNISGTALGEAELSQINLYEYEINTEDDIARDDYVTTVLYNPQDAKGSLLDRILEKAPHYSIGHVDESIASIQRTFTFNGISILDALYQIAEEIDCIFMIDSSSKADGSIARTINAYDLETTCNNCGHRGVYTGTCPECGSTDLSCGYGNDTNIYVSQENLTDEISYSSNTDSVKNCFRLVGGDDLMTATIANCNPNGSGYLWYFSEDMKADMSDALRTKLEQYESEHDYYANRKVVSIPQALVSAYNNIITKYRTYRPSLNTLSSSIAGYSALMNAYYDTIDFEMYLRHELMPSVEISPTDAATEAAKLTATLLSPTAVANLSVCSSATATSAVQSVAKQIVDKAYQVRADGTLSGTTWTGTFTVNNYSDSDDTATTGSVSVTITDNQQTYLRQRIDSVLSETTDGDVGIKALFHMTLANFKNEIKKYCLSSLNSFRDICQSCVDILIDQGIADKKTWSGMTPNLYNDLYVPYYQKLEALYAEVSVRENELLVITGALDDKGGVTKDGIHTVIQRENEAIQAHLDIEKFFGNALMEELSAYRREDEYNNDNFVSDGLNNRDLFARALEFIALAREEIYKSATLQHTITATLKNLLVMQEFQPIVDHFEVGNWITIRADEKLCRLRLIGYEIDFDNLDSLNVDFSDVVETVFGRNDLESIIKSASSISTSFGVVKRQASKGESSQNQLVSFATDGLSLTKMRIVDSAENQNVTMDHHGLLCRELVPYNEEYSDKQLRLINKGLYMTDDGWESSKAAIGDFFYFDPATGTEKEAYGVIADLLMGNLVLSEAVGIYNKRGTIKLDQNGLTLISANDGNPRDVFRIQKKNGNTVTNVIYIDDSGNAHFAGTLEAANGTFEGTLSASCITSGTLNVARIGNNSIGVGKLTGSISGGINNSWVLDLENGTLTIGNISAGNITSGTMSANRISGGTLTLGGNNNANGTLTVKDASGNTIGTWNKDGISATKGTFSGALNGATGTFEGTLSAACITSGTLNADRIAGNSIGVGKLSGSITGGLNNSWGINFTNGTMTIGNISAANIATGTLSADRIAANSIAVGKLTGSITGGLNNTWSINLTNGTMTIGNISADNITTGSLSANRITGGTLDCSDITVKNLAAESISGTNTSPVTGTLTAYRYIEQGGLEIEQSATMTIKNGIIIGLTGYT